MTYEEAKLHKQNLEEKNKIASAKLGEFDKYGKSAIGTTPDSVREMEEWKESKKTYDITFSEMREFNGWFVKTFKKEYAQDRRNRFANKV